jgi:predicted RNase H-like nuclease
VDGWGVQPADQGPPMFPPDAPIWRFLGKLDAMDDPEQARKADQGFYLMEVFPALALPSIEPIFFGRLKGPRYNPARRKTFRPKDSARVAVRAPSRAPSLPPSPPPLPRTSASLFPCGHLIRSAGDEGGEVSPCAP